jgi:hypothetical protein
MTRQSRTRGGSVRNKILATIVVLGGVAAVAGMSVTAATASTTHAKAARTHTAPTCPSGDSGSSAYCTCPSGDSGSTAYCTCPKGDSGSTAYCTCPKGDSGSTAYCTCPKGDSGASGYCSVSPQEPPTVGGWKFWWKKHHHEFGLRFRLKKGIDGAPDLKSFVCNLPSGLSFVKLGKHSKLSSHSNAEYVRLSAHSLKIELKKAVASVTVTMPPGFVVESDAFVASVKHKVMPLTFTLGVTDTSGHSTQLAFTVKHP